MENKPRTLHLVLKYLFYLCVSFLIISLCWSFIALGKYFVCTDPIPVADFFPPFVHGVRIGDYFVQGKSVAYDIWYFLVAGIFLLPFISLYIKNRKQWKKGRALLVHTTLSVVYAILILYALWIVFLVTIFAVPIFVILVGVFWFKKKLNPILVGICSLCLAISMTIIGHAFSQSTSAPPEPLFPLDDPQATYLIQMLGDSYAVIYTKNGEEDQYAYVGNSTTELEEFRGLPVLITGDNTHFSNIQCIQHVCHEILPPHFGESVSTAVIDINGIETKK